MMFIILVYDAGDNRNAKVLKIGRRFLHRVQNSVLEGTITESAYMRMMREIEDVLDAEDSVIVYRTIDAKNVDRVTIGNSITPNTIL